MKVRDAMSKDAITVRLDSTLREVQALFARNQVDVIVVVGRDQSGWMRRVIGVVTRADLLRTLIRARTASARTLLRSKTASEVLRRVRSLRPTDSLGEATQRLLGTGLAALPVTGSDGRMTGMLSLGDVLERDARSLRSVG